ncbi:glycosyltransferase family 2 protein [Dactylosporangium sp. AC04546]|uniref:glycosyltransferase family 2 protein n=1 Tax=Dactylosporangium sp. AC04546 TaxID=2862460 RepID=UPI001EE0E2B0|nr:glycosyltransferase family 2 protein [Dactylosporangium sp. AC04546]WVK79784.1 glycosyltransferase family 2 protein [Dactylosporangium sp. AC04546]
MARLAADTTGVDLVAVLIVRDEADTLPACLASLAGVVDAVHVHDTGSVDGTPGVARSLGAAVSGAPWPGDFAAARNAALDASGARDWVLSIDADERLVVGRAPLVSLLARGEAYAVDVDNRHDELPYTHRPVRLFRPAGLRWTGRVHEHLTPPKDWPAAPRDVVHIVHEGYADPQTRRRKALRNAELARAALAAAPSPGNLLDLGRSLVGAGLLQEAVDTFERLRETFPGTREWVLGTDALARLLLAAGVDDAVVVLTRQLRTAGVEPQYCDWLEAQALAQLGHAGDAWRLLRGVREVVDPAGRRYAPGHLTELKRLLGSLVHGELPLG